jgi:hypothetical protein
VGPHKNIQGTTHMKKTFRLLATILSVYSCNTYAIVTCPPGDAIYSCSGTDCIISDAIKKDWMPSWQNPVSSKPYHFKNTAVFGDGSTHCVYSSQDGEVTLLNRSQNHLYPDFDAPGNMWHKVNSRFLKGTCYPNLDNISACPFVKIDQINMR